jgi:alkanesulfonate monooxygenase SsuD/methylene tetrahydromethanopterin reductase-like flavin-dependent oxidoreductase (luciferase family)
MAGVNIAAAGTDATAHRLFTTTQQAFANLVRGRPGPQQPPVDDIDEYWTPSEKVHASRMLKYAIVGGPDTVREGLRRFAAATQADELMAVTNVYDHAARVRSFEILAEVARSIPEADRRG